MVGAFILTSLSVSPCLDCQIKSGGKQMNGRGNSIIEPTQEKAPVRTNTGHLVRVKTGVATGWWAGSSAGRRPTAVYEQ